MARNGSRRGRGYLAAALSLTLLVGCTGKQPSAGDDGGGETYRLNGRALSEGEYRYGLAPKPHDDVTYQPDVVLVGGGGEAVRSVTADGLTWRIDPKADRAGELAVGKVMFLTSRAVGRVVDVQHADGDLVVTTAPVDITEVIRDATFSGEQAIALDDVISYTAEDSLWADVSEDGGYTSDNLVTNNGSRPVSVPARQGGAAPPMDLAAGTIVLPPVTFVGSGATPAPQQRVEQPRPVNGPPKQLRAAGFQITSMCCDGGVGAHLSYHKDGIQLVGTIAMIMERPSARFHLSISGGKVSAAELQVSGGTGLKVNFRATSTVGAGHQLNKTFAVPIDFSVPVGLVLGVPFTLTSNQWVIVKTALSSKDANLDAAGEYTFGGTLGFGYRNGAFGAHLPQDLKFTRSLIESIKGMSIGINAVIMAYSTRFFLGIGAFGFTAGLYFGLTLAVSALKGSAGGFPCRSATLGITANYGVGYSVPQLAVEVVNFFLKVFKAKPLQRTGGIGGSTKVIDRKQAIPENCA